MSKLCTFSNFIQVIKIFNQNGTQDQTLYHTAISLSLG